MPIGKRSLSQDALDLVDQCERYDVRSRDERRKDFFLAVKVVVERRLPQAGPARDARHRCVADAEFTEEANGDTEDFVGGITVSCPRLESRASDGARRSDTLVCRCGGTHHGRSVATWRCAHAGRRVFRVDEFSAVRVAATGGGVQTVLAFRR